MAKTFKVKKVLDNLRKGGYLVVADFVPPEGEKQMDVENIEDLVRGSMFVGRYQILTDREFKEVMSIFENACKRLQEVEVK